jgi:hypothetical protein
MSILQQEKDKVEKRLVFEAMSKFDKQGDRAKYLGVSNRTFLSLCKKFNIESEYKERCKKVNELKYFIPFFEIGSYPKAFEVVNYPAGIWTYRGKLISLIGTEVYRLFKEKRVNWKNMLEKFGTYEPFTDIEMIVLKKLISAGFINKKGELLC